MLCCGLLAVIAATIAGSWRHLRAARWTIAVGGGAALLALPAMALGTAGQETPMSRSEVVAQAMQMLCGEAAD